MLQFGVTALLLFSMSSEGSEVIRGIPLETEHLSLVWTEELDDEIASVLMEKSERLYQQTVEFLQHEGTERPVVVFRGPARTGPGTRRDFPFVDDQGVVSLFRFTGDVESYFNAFVHELVHSLRIDRLESSDGFFEEGFAEFVRLRVYDSMEGFPWFGFPVSVVAAGHLTAGSAIPLDTLRLEHSAMNLPCRAQAYALRSAFFDWLGREYGDEAVLQMSRESVAGELEQYEHFFGEPFDELSSKWARAMLDQHDSELFDEYMANSPIRYVRICPTEGVE